MNVQGRGQKRKGVLAEEHPFAFGRSPSLAAVVVGVAREGALDAVPAVLDGVLGIAPGELGLALGLLPAVLEFVLGLVELAAGLGARRVVAVLVGGGEVVVRTVGRVGALGVAVTPVGIFHGGIDALGHALAGQTAGDTADGGADHRTHRAAHGSADGRA